MTKENLIKELNSRIQEQKNFIFERAEGIVDGKLSEDDKIDLLDIDITGEIFTHYDWDDRENHNFDLGNYYALTNLLNYIKK